MNDEKYKNTSSISEDYYTAATCEALREVFGTDDFIELLKRDIYIPPEQAVPALIRTVWANVFEEQVSGR